MNRVTDLLLSAQLCTSIAAIFMYLAHLIENGTILNPEWKWMYIASLALAVFWMLFPHLICHKE